MVLRRMIKGSSENPCVSGIEPQEIFEYSEGPERRIAEDKDGSESKESGRGAEHRCG